MCNNSDVQILFFVHASWTKHQLTANNSTSFMITSMFSAQYFLTIQYKVADMNRIQISYALIQSSPHPRGPGAQNLPRKPIRMNL
jgi:hypothetical protein